MGRPHRPTPPDGWHHVFSRGIRRTTIYRCTDDRLHYLGLADRAFERYDVKVFAYCLLDNHVHLGLHDPSGQISGAMQQLGRNYTRYFNDRYGFDGPLCKSRFGSRLLGDDRDLIGVSRYIHRNALDIDATAPMDDYRWTSFGRYMGARSSDLACLVTDPVLPLAGGASAYRRLAEHDGPLIAPATRRPLVNVPEIEHEVRRVYGDAAGDLGPLGAGRKNDARRCAATLARDLIRLTPEMTCWQYGYRDNAQCLAAIARYRLRLKTDHELGSRHERVISGLLRLVESRAS